MTTLTAHSINKMLAEIRELLGEQEWIIAYRRWEYRAREDALALRKAVDDLKRKLLTVRNRAAWLYQAYTAQHGLQEKHEDFRTEEQLTGLPMH